MMILDERLIIEHSGFERDALGVKNAENIYAAEPIGAAYDLICLGR
jgi:hypothetical protein